MVTNEKEKTKTIKRSDIVKNDYIKKKQSLIYETIEFNKKRKKLEKSLYQLKGAKGYSWKKINRNGKHI